MLLRRTNQRCADYFRLGCCFLPANGSAVYRRFPVLIVGLKSSGIVRRCRNLPILQKRQKQQHIAAGAPLWQPVADPISDGDSGRMPWTKSQMILLCFSLQPCDAPTWLRFLWSYCIKSACSGGPAFFVQILFKSLLGFRFTAADAGFIVPARHRNEIKALDTCSFYRSKTRLLPVCGAVWTQFLLCHTIAANRPRTHSSNACASHMPKMPSFRGKASMQPTPT